MAVRNVVKYDEVFRCLKSDEQYEEGTTKSRKSYSKIFV